MPSLRSVSSPNIAVTRFAQVTAVTRNPLLTGLLRQLDSCQSSRCFFGFCFSCVQSVCGAGCRKVKRTMRDGCSCKRCSLPPRHCPYREQPPRGQINKGKFMAATVDPRQSKSNRGPHERPLNAGHCQTPTRASCAPCGPCHGQDR